MQSEYDAYGDPHNQSGTFDNPFGYCGEYTDSESGLVYLRARMYDPSIGRFISEDPIKDGNNWYMYCNGNPLKYIDPWGLGAKVNGDDEFKSMVEADLETLTGRDIIIDETGVISIGDIIENEKGEKAIGTQLLSDLLEDDTIFTIAKGDNHFRDRDNTILYDGCATRVLTVNGYQETPAFVVLGHEMCHAWDYMNGIQGNEGDGYSRYISFFTYRDPLTGVDIAYSNNTDDSEYVAIGIGYLEIKLFDTPTGGQIMGDIFYRKPYQISENAIRRENDLPQRIMH